MQMQHSDKRKVVLVDDHVLLRNGLASLVKSFDEYTVLFEASNGRHFIEQVDPEQLPDIVLMDINMPEKDGFETTLWLKQNYPSVKVLALSMYDNDQSIIRMLKNGAKGYILKDTEPKEFRAALDSVSRKGFYYTELVGGRLIHAVNFPSEPESPLPSEISLNEREAEFVRLACTEMTYKEIADRMVLSPRTIDGYRDSVFEKLNVKSRVGLALYAIRNGIVAV
jgi:two-component system, NarL family, invasion response regulator UvrY